MKLLDLTLGTSAENLALDEALLNELDTRGQEALRLWEPQRPLVVLGRSSRIRDEVDLEFCEAAQIEVMRRNSGGASIVTGPGCLMYAVTLDLRERPELRSLDVAHCFVLRQVREALVACGADVTIQGTSDLTLGDRKFSGNSLRVTRNGLLYHGTLLNQFELELIPKCLKTPPRQPDYRQQRSHADFLTQLQLDPQQIKQQLSQQWKATSPYTDWPETNTQQLVVDKYSQADWHFRI